MVSKALKKVSLSEYFAASSGNGEIDWRNLAKRGISDQMPIAQTARKKGPPVSGRPSV
jgi:hypothetical protein